MRIDKITGVFNCVSCGFKGNIFQHFGTKTDWLGVQRERFKSLIQEKLVETVGLDIPTNAVPFEQDWRGISGETFKKFRAFQHPDYPNRVMFPLTDRAGKIRVFCGRDLANNTPKYKFYPGGRSPPIFPQVKPYNGNIILVEGIMDMLNLHDKGLTNAVCLFGLNLPDKDIDLLKIQGVSSITVLLDSDEPGQKAADRIVETLDNNEIPTKKYTLQTVKDPGELTALQVIKLKENLYGG
jgi:5S rRNA maturation endonuclease (ribonuclease M5)